MAKSPVDDFVDDFWGPNHTFDIANSDAWPDRTRVVYLHGGLHLVRETNGAVRKRTAQAENLLQSFGRLLMCPCSLAKELRREQAHINQKQRLPHFRVSNTDR